MKHYKVYQVFFLLGVILVSSIGLLVYSIKDRESTAANENLKMKMVLIPKATDETNDFWMSMIDGADVAAKEYDVELKVMGPHAEAEYELQNELIEKAIKEKPDAILLAACDYEKTLPYAKKVEKAGIKLILLDSVMSEKVGESVIATDNYEGGYKMGEYIKPYITQDSVIGIVGHVKTASTATEREQGIRAALGENADQIVDVVYCDSDFVKAYEVTRDMLKRYPEMDVIFGLNEYSSVGAARAVRSMGKTSQVRLVGFDSSMEEIQLLESGVFDAFVVQRSFNMGYLGVSVAYKAVLNQGIQDNVDSGSVLITKDTIYTKENQKLLFPFDMEK